MKLITMCQQAIRSAVNMGKMRVYTVLYAGIPTVEKEESRRCYVCCAADASLSVGNMELITNVTQTQTNKSSGTDTQTYAAKSRHPVA